MSDWYYEEDGAHRGPIAEPDLAMMLSNGLLPRDTRVWTEAFGQAWKPAHQTALVPPAPAGPPPLAKAPPPLAPATATHAPQAGSQGTVRPYSATYARLIAFEPLGILALDILLAIAGINPSIPPVSTGIGFWSAVLAIWLAHKDAQQIRAAGLNPQARTLVPFILLTPVGYFWRRNVIAGTSLGYLWIWLACAVVFLFVEIGLFA